MENTTNKQVMTTQKALTVIGTLAVLIGLTFITPAKLVGINSPKKQALILRTGNELADLQGDRDGNGIPDWKDLINETMSTSTKNAASKAIISEETKKRLNDPDNLTASFSKNIYIASAYAKKKGNLTQAQQEELASNAIVGEENKITFKTYEMTDLHLSKDESLVAKKDYGNALGKAYALALKAKVGENDLTIIKAYSTNKDASVLTSLAIKKGVLATAITALLAIPVPYSAAPYHLLVINRLSQYVSILDNLSKADSDPLRATFAINSYIETVKSMFSSFASLQNYFIIEGVTFTKSDPAFILISEYTNQ